LVFGATLLQAGSGATIVSLRCHFQGRQPAQDRRQAPRTWRQPGRV